jgi:hypothetical protein
MPWKMARRKAFRNVVLGSGLVLCLGCAHFTDPAVRLARCMEREARALDGSSHERMERACRLGTPGGYLVILHPEGTLSDEELLRGGVPQSMVTFLRRFRIGTHEAVYVFPFESVKHASRTTYQHRFVRIPQLMVLERATPEPVVVQLVKAQDAMEVETLK